MVPYNTLFQPNATFSFFERTFHREENGGWERWEFEIDGEQFLFDGDVRYLPEEKESVLIFGFFKKPNNSSFDWDYIRKTDANSAKLIGCVMEIIDKVSFGILNMLLRYAPQNGKKQLIIFYIIFVDLLQIRLLKMC